MEPVKATWKIASKVFPILTGDFAGAGCSREDYEILLGEILKDQSMSLKIHQLVLSAIETRLRRNITPRFWQRFIVKEDLQDMQGFQRFKVAVTELYDNLLMMTPVLERVEHLRRGLKNAPSVHGEITLIAGFKQIVRATLLSQLPLEHQRIIFHFYKISFNVFSFADSEELAEMGEDSGHCGGCGYELENDCQCQYIVKVFHDTNRKLVDLQLLEVLTGRVLTGLIETKIENNVQETCKGTFDVSHLSFLESWLDVTVVSWLTRIYCGGSAKPTNEDPVVKEAIENFKRRLSYSLYETYTRTRIDQLFNIIIEYPDSQPAIEDIKVCLGKTELRSTLSRKLQEALETRLLHPGVNTPDILTAYIAAIRALRHLDPSGVLLVTVTRPVRNYLRTRDDTVRSVVSSLTEDGSGNELAEELARVSAETVSQSVADNEDDAAWEQWMPDPVDADPVACSKYRKSSDIISMLVNVYGSKELFVNEYRTLLADRLLSHGNFSTDNEIRHLELLKIKFGETQLHFCEVMLKDISDSKRINAVIEKDPAFGNTSLRFPSNAMILSAQFWPPFKDETLELPSEIQEHLDIYTKAFEALKGNRTLNWKPHLGIVKLEVEVGGKTLNLSVSPMHATIILHFEKKPEWDLNELSQVMKVPATSLRRKIIYWQSLGVIAETSPDKYTLIDGEESNAKAKSAPILQSQEMVCEEEEESVMASAHDQREGELQVFWSYIVGMLTNLDSMPLERIYQMLKMFAAQGPGMECSSQSLRQFLDQKVRSHQLVFQGGLYKLPKM